VFQNLKFELFEILFEFVLSTQAILRIKLKFCFMKKTKFIVFRFEPAKNNSNGIVEIESNNLFRVH
jgi:hypothetical protein